MRIQFLSHTYIFSLTFLHKCFLKRLRSLSFPTLRGPLFWPLLAVVLYFDFPETYKHPMTSLRKRSLFFFTTLLNASCLYLEDNMLVFIKIDEISRRKEPLNTNKDKNSKSKWIN